MEVILLERIEKLGQMGDVVSVKPGFARNFLLPQGKALRATNQNKKQFDQQRVQLEAENLKRKSEAEAVAAKMTDMKVILIRQAGDAGQLYGSVTARDIADAVVADGITIRRAQVVLDTPIKTIGLHQVRIDLHSEVSVKITANVARSKDEAETQEKTGGAVLSLAQQEQHEILAEAEAAADAAVIDTEHAGVIFEEDALQAEEDALRAAEEDASEEASS